MPDWARFMEHAARPEPTVFRAVTRRIEPADLVQRLSAQGFVVRELEAMPSFFTVVEGPRPLSHTYEHWAGLLYVQQASTGIAAPALAPGAGARILDLCSSPGGKLAHLAELTGGQGTLVACDVDERRIRGLLGNLYRLLVPNVVVVAGDGRSFPAGASFDHVLLDAPCSGEGTLRKRSGDAPNRSKRFLAYVTRAQRALLDRAVGLVRPGGTILYVTCTFAPEENEAVVSDLLARAPVDLEPLAPAVPHAPGLTHFEGAQYDARLEGAVRIYPQHLDSGGLFMAKLRRLDGPATVADPRGAWRPLPAAFPQSWSQDGRDRDSRGEDEAALRIADSVEAVRVRHDIDPDFLRSCGWILRGDTVWVHRLHEWPLEAWGAGEWRAVSVGLRAIEIDTSGRARATNDLLRFASTSVRARVVDVDPARACRLLAGEPEPAEASSPLGPVALRHRGDVVGRGRYGKEGLTSEIPKARAQDLLRALAPETGSAASADDVGG